MAQIRLIGTDPSQVPTNGMLGSLAFQSAESVSIGIVGVDKGAVSLPSITFIGDTNTGIFSPGADQVAISTNGTGRLFVDSAGNVDIASSSQTLTLLNLNALTTGNAAIRFNDTTANIGNINYNFTDDALTFRVNAGERLRITSAGLVGIGTSSPGGLLELSSNASGTLNGEVLLQRIRSNTSNNTFVDIKSRRHTAGSTWEGAGFRLQHQVDGTPMGFLEFNSLAGGQDVAIGTGNSTRLLITSAGNVGIGTTSPANTLQVDADSEFNIFAIQRKTSPTATFSLGINSAQTQTNINYQTDGLAFTRLGTEGMRLDGSRRLLVGTSTARTNFFNAATSSIFQVEGAGGAPGRISSQVFGAASSNGPIHVLAKHRGAAVGGTDVVVDADQLGIISFQGSDGTEFVEGATIAAFVDGTPGANDMPGRLVFSTTADGGSSPTERMRISSSGQILAGALGTAASPIISFLNDPNTGIFSPGADQVAISTNGVARLTTSTTAVSSSLAIDHPLGAEATPSITFTGDLNTGFYSPAADTLAAVTAGSNRLHITSGGLVGIGTSSPDGALHVVGGGSTTSTIALNGIGGVGNNAVIAATSSLYYQIDSNNNIGSRVFNWRVGGKGFSNGTSLMTLNAAGQLGIGTTSPGSTLTVKGSARIQDATSFAGLNIRNDNDSSVVTTTSFLDVSNNLGTIDGHIFFEHLTTGGSNAVIATTPTGDRAVDRRVARLNISFAGTTSLSSATSTAPFIANIGASEVARIDSSGCLLVGTSTSTVSYSDWRLQVLGQTVLGSFIGANANAYSHNFIKSRSSTVGIYTTVVSGDKLGGINFNGDDGTDYETTAASIDAFVDGTPGANDMPGRLVFSTTADGAAFPTERMRIASTGAIGLSGGNYGTVGQVLTSNGSATAPTWQAGGGGGGSVDIIEVMLFG